MGRKAIFKKQTIVEINTEKYLQPPPYDQIREYINGELKISMLHFERFFGIPTGTLKQIPFGHPLPAKYWHLIYDKVKPKYGTGFYNPDTAIIEKGGHRKKYSIKKEVEKKEVKSSLNDSLLNILKQKLD